MNQSDPVQAFRNLTPDQFFDALEAQRIPGSKMRCDGRFLALNSYENRVYQIGIEDEESIIAKFYRPQRWADHAIIEEHRFTQDLAQAEIPVIAPLADEQGNTLFHHGPFRFSIYPCRGGRPLELDNPEHLLQMGRLIARIHRIGSSGCYQHRPTIDADQYIAQPRQFLLDNHFIPEHLIEAYGSLSSMLLDQVRHCFDRAAGFKVTRLHGDFHPGNVLCTDDGPHIVDFDDARNGPAIQDLWLFLSGDRNYMTLMLSKLLEGYCQFNEFDPIELHLLEALRTMRMIYHAGWLASRWQDPAFPIAFPWFNEISYWEDHILSLREQAAALDEAPLDWVR